MPSESAREIVRGWISTLLASLLLGFLFFYAFIMGIWIAGAGLHDPDTCWLLAVGKTILESGAVPVSDPFSYTFSALAADGTVDLAVLTGVKSMTGASPPAGGRVFVPYQWFCELLFYLAYKIGAGYALLLMVNCVLVLAFLAGPLMLYRALRSPMLVGAVFSILSVMAASFHFLARPEIFSYINLMILFALLVRVRLKLENNRPFNQRDLPQLLPFAILMAIWANTHTGFTSALIVMGIFCLTTSFEVMLRKRAKNSVLVLPWLVFAALIAGTFVNPFGIGLWQYIPGLFFSPINKYICELSPITVNHLTDWAFYPYYFLGASMLVVLFKAVKSWIAKSRLPIGFTFSIVMSAAVFIAGLSCLRLIPFAVLFLATEIAWLLKGYSRSGAGASGSATASASEFGAGGSGTASPSEFGAASLLSLSEIDRRLNAMTGDRSWPLMFLVFSIIGTILVFARLAKPVIPQSSDAFQAPFKAITYLAKELPPGRVLNDAQFGDMMIWYLNASDKPILIPDPFPAPPVARKPRVFIDTRFDMYGPHLCEDYHAMVELKPGGAELFERYQFDWVFLPPEKPLARELSRSRLWQRLFGDETFVIFTRAASPAGQNCI